MKRSAASLAIFSIVAATGAEPVYRAAGFDTADLPRVTAILDGRSAPDNAKLPTPGDFRLLEDGKATSIAKRSLKFRDTGLPLAIIVALDASPSMKGRPMNAIRQGLAQLVARKRSQDKIAVVSFADDIRWDARWSSSPTEVQDAFRNLQARGNRTRLYDAVAESINELQKQSRDDAEFPLRRAILVLSDGHDEGSQGTLKEISERLKKSRIRLDAVGLARSPLWLRSLQEMAHSGFGEFRTTSSPETLTELLDHGIDLLLDSPALEFDAHQLPADGKVHQVAIEDVRSGWRDQIAVKTPARGILNPPWLYVLIGAGVLLIAMAAWMILRRQPRRSPAVTPVSTAPAPVSPKPPPRPRAETVAETSASAVQTGWQPGPAATAAAPAPTPPQRAATVMVPETTPRTGPPALVALAGPYAGQRFEISAQEFWIGSSANNHLRLTEDPGVSGNHACIRSEGQFCRIYDNESLNNTWVNGQPLGAGVALLVPGDRIRIGQSELAYQS